jgi:antitoxin FitA
MTLITIPLSEGLLARLHTYAEQSGLSPEEFLRRRIEQLLESPDERFRQAANHVLQKNAELYRRLA